MTVDYAWIQGSGGDIPAYSAKMDRRVIGALWDEGVIRGLKVSANSTDRVMTVAVGQGVITGDDTTDQGNYLASVVGTGNTVTLSAAPGTGSRIDLVGLLVQDVVEGGAAGNDIVVAKVDGVAAASPTVPAVPDSFLVLAQTIIDAGQTAMLPGDVTDRRVFTEAKQAVGSVKLWAGPAQRIPVGWVVLNGQAVGPFSAYPELSDLLGVTTGNVSVPADTQGRVVAGIAASQATYDTVGEQSGAATSPIGIDNLPQHRHANNHDHGEFMSAQDNVSHTHSGTTGNDTPDHTHGISPGDFVVTAFATSLGVGPGSGAIAVSNTGGASVRHHHPFTTGGVNNLHAHEVEIPPWVGFTDYTGSATPAALPVVQPTVALYYLMRVT